MWLDPSGETLNGGEGRALNEVMLIPVAVFLWRGSVELISELLQFKYLISSLDNPTRHTRTLPLPYPPLLHPSPVIVSLMKRPLEAVLPPCLLCSPGRRGIILEATISSGEECGTDFLHFYQKVRVDVGVWRVFSLGGYFPGTVSEITPTKRPQGMIRKKIKRKTFAQRAPGDTVQKDADPLMED